MSKRKILFGVTWSLVFVPLLYMSTCSVISSKRARSFEAISIGDTRERVIFNFGTAPVVREKNGDDPFRRYTSYPCEAPCVERFWFENRMGMDINAWSVEFDKNGKVIKKSHWLSP